MYMIKKFDELHSLIIEINLCNQVVSVILAMTSSYRRRELNLQ